MRKLSLLAAATIMVSGRADGQHVASARVAAAAPSRMASVQDPQRAAPVSPADGRQAASRARVFWVRTLTATTLSLVGAYAGYQLGHTYTPVTERSDYDLTGQEAIGLAIGFFGGAAYGAAVHSYDSSCSGTKRFVRGAVGAVLGVVPGLVLGPFGPGLGAAAGQGRC